MASSKLAGLPSLRRQNLLAEFAGLKQACPEGVFVTLTPGDPSLWSGVIFVRKGPYASAVLRFQISFPDTYPTLPPLVTFSTDIFHPLIAPLTTYMYTTDIQDNGTVSATDEERLPPGGFSLRHGFPAWFGRGSRNKRASGQQQLLQNPQQGSSTLRAQTPPRSGTDSANASVQSTPNSSGLSPHSRGAAAGAPSYAQSRPITGEVSTYDVLRYVRSTFDDEAVLNTITLEAAGNPGAWHAWRAHQRQQGKLFPEDGFDANAPATVPTGGSGAASTPSNVESSATRNPGEWNWEHVWEERVKKGISASLSDPVLFGSAGAADDVIRFLSMEDGDIESVKDNLKRTLGASA